MRLAGPTVTDILFRFESRVECDGFSVEVVVIIVADLSTQYLWSWVYV